MGGTASGRSGRSNWAAKTVAAVVASCALPFGCSPLAGFSEQVGPLTARSEAARDATRDTDPSNRGATELIDRSTAPAEARRSATREIVPGTGRFVGEQTDGQRVQAIRRQGEIVLNFENAALRDVVKTILGETLDVNYVIDPRVSGTVTMQTSRPIRVENLLETLETILRMNGAALVREADYFRIVPADEAIGGSAVPQLGTSEVPLPSGRSVLIIPLQYVSALQMEQILEPFLPPNGILRVDIDRNLVVLAGNRRELRALHDTVRTFDVDWLAGMSVGMYPISFVDAETIAAELEQAMRTGEKGPLAGLLQFIPIKRLNALLVVTPQRDYLDYVETWIKRLDKASTSEQNLYVYHLRYGKAADVARILTQIFTDGAAPERRTRSDLAPGRQPVQLRTRETAGTRSQQQAQAQPQSRQTPAPREPERPAAVSREGAAAVSVVDAGGGIRIIADEVNNALIILARPQEYNIIESAVRRIDIVPLQVLIEATIVEVTLNDALNLGLQWFFKSGNFAATLSRLATGAVTAQFPGFGLVYQTPNSRAILDALESVTTIKVVSSPHLLVQDNQEAELQVGDEVPIATQQQQSPTTSTAPLVNTIQFRDTGVILRVVPRVTAGGSVTMEIEQEVSSVSNVETLTPTISQRRMRSTVSIQSGDTIVLGGLISENNQRTRAGLPGLSQIPILGLLFGQDSVKSDRTELLVLITPSVVRNSEDARTVTEEITRKLNVLKTFNELIDTPRSQTYQLLR